MTTLSRSCVNRRRCLASFITTRTAGALGTALLRCAELRGVGGDYTGRIPRDDAVQRSRLRLLRCSVHNPLCHRHGWCQRSCLRYSGAGRGAQLIKLRELKHAPLSPSPHPQGEFNAFPTTAPNTSVSVAFCGCHAAGAASFFQTPTLRTLWTDRRWLDFARNNRDLLLQTQFLPQVIEDRRQR